jgi:hypothetical protein
VEWQRRGDAADEAQWWRRACALTQIIHLELRHDVLPCIFHLFLAVLISVQCKPTAYYSPDISYGEHALELCYLEDFFSLYLQAM